MSYESDGMTDISRYKIFCGVEYSEGRWKHRIFMIYHPAEDFNIQLGSGGDVTLFVSDFEWGIKKENEEVITMIYPNMDINVFNYILRGLKDDVLLYEPYSISSTWVTEKDMKDA